MVIFRMRTAFRRRRMVVLKIGVLLRNLSCLLIFGRYITTSNCK